MLTVQFYSSILHKVTETQKMTSSVKEERREIKVELGQAVAYRTKLILFWSDVESVCV